MTLEDLTPLPLEVAQSRHLSEGVADAITQAIAQGILKPGDRLIEEAIAAKLSVSRVPLREAIRTLQAQGLLAVTPNRGTRVVMMDDKTVMQVHEARIALERIAARGAVAAFRADRRRLEPLQDAIAMMVVARTRNDWTALRRCDMGFHLALCLASDNDIVLKLWQALSRHITIIFGREIAEEHDFDVVIQQHERLLAMLEEGSPGLDEEIRSHILRLSEQVSGLGAPHRPPVKPPVRATPPPRHRSPSRRP
jgi:DNA-binding GntR family transcriptional regulator